MPKKLNLPKKEICEEYLKNVTTGELAEKYKCHPTTILNILHSNKIKIKSKLNLPIDQIIVEYQNGIDAPEIAKKYNCTYTPIYDILKNANIKIRKRGESKIINLPINQIINDYKNGMTLVELGNKYECSYGTIDKRLRKSDVEMRSAKCLNLSPEQIAINREYSSISNQKTKSLYSITEESCKIRIQCNYNTKTDSITITSTIYRNGSIDGKINKSCTEYLGINIAEYILSKIFKNVEIMPRGNPGFDFICNNGFKIDVKSATLNKNRDRWQFTIKKNKIADYFLCLAFDNRKDLNPLHLWLIPGHVINNLYGTGISKSSLNMWSKYEQPLDKVLDCCNIMKKYDNGDIK